MSFITSTQVEDCLRQCRFPGLNVNLMEAGWLQGMQIESSSVHIQLKLGFPAARAQAMVQKTVQEALSALPGVTQITVSVQWNIRSHAVQPGVSALPGVKNVIAIASGKGGVGKSTTAVNLALALLQEGAQVGLLDADIYGPNQPHILGAIGRPEIRENKTIVPLPVHGLQTMSIGYLVDAATPMVWRGPMISAALQQLVSDTMWDHLDYLIVDLPPGTGDIQLTLAKKVPVSAVVMVTTPQEVALLDVRKGIEMFRKVNVNVLGVIENMSDHICTQCGHREALFGQGGGQRLAAAYEMPLLGQVPLSRDIQEAADGGCPTVISGPEGALAQCYRDIALRIALRLSLEKINYAAKFPKVVVE